jgi:hypothetical protein
MTTIARIWPAGWLPAWPMCFDGSGHGQGSEDGG